MRLFITIFFLFASGPLLWSQQSDCNCCSEDHRAFDFWLGEWEVVNPDGSAAGTNRIEKLQDGCLLKESWKSASSGYTGTSVNFYNSAAGQWEQIWVDNSGGQLHLKGNRQGNMMVLRSEEVAGEGGAMVSNRISWTLNDDGSVRQLWELLTDGTVSQVLFDGHYTPVE